MLKQVFTSETIPYQKMTDRAYWLPPDGTAVFGNPPITIWYDEFENNIYPYWEKLFTLNGLFASSAFPTLTSATSIFQFAWMQTNYFPYVDAFFFQWDGQTGAYIPFPTGINNSVGHQPADRRGFFPGLISEEAYHYVVQSRQDRLFFGFGLSGPTILTEFNIGNYTPVNPQTYTAASYPSHVGPWVFPLVDEIQDTIVDAISTISFSIGVWKASVPTLLHTFVMPETPIQIVKAEINQAYVLCKNQVLVLIDYVAMEVLGMVKIPGTNVSGGYTGTNINIAWDKTYQRLLVFEKTPDNVSGSCASIIRGYRVVPVATRLTAPVPLQRPIQGKTIPVLVQCVGDLNEGVGGQLITVTASGPASVVGQLPVTDGEGDSIVHVDCLNAGTVTLNAQTDVP